MIIVTGASRGLGKAICERLTEKGENVVKLVRSIEEVDKSAIECDVTNYSSVKIAAREIKKIKKPLKAFINAAGVASMNMAVTADKSTVQKLIQTNLVEQFLLLAFCTANVKTNCGSLLTFFNCCYCIKGVYIPLKPGLRHFQSFAREMADFNVRLIVLWSSKTDLRSITESQLRKLCNEFDKAVQKV